jgi:hypothetical protein
MATVARVVVHRLIDRFIVLPSWGAPISNKRIPVASDKQILGRERFVAETTRKGGATEVSVQKPAPTSVEIQPQRRAE